MCVWVGGGTAGVRLFRGPGRSRLSVVQREGPLWRPWQGYAWSPAPQKLAALGKGSKGACARPRVAPLLSGGRGALQRGLVSPPYFPPSPVGAREGQ